jgi:hypothetical protein
MIVNIWAKLSNIVDFLKTKTEINTAFPWGIYSAIPIEKPTDTYLYINLISNLKTIKPQNSQTLVKEWIINFAIVWKDQSMTEKSIYNILDIISNNIVSNPQTCENFTINMWSLKVFQIEEWSQTWVLRDRSQIPYLSAEYTFYYASLI